MDAHERRNDLPPANEREAEFLVHGTFCVAEGDRGFWDTRWLTSESILEYIDKTVLAAKVEAFKIDLMHALQAVTDPPPSQEV